jgi:hypothetical protein
MNSPQRSVERYAQFRDGSDMVSAAAERFSSRNLTRVALSRFSLDVSLEVDPRPSFVVDLDSSIPNHLKDGREQLQIAYTNPALMHDISLMDEITGNFLESRKIGLSRHRRHADFKTWVMERNYSDSSPFMFKDFLWTAYTLQDKAHSYRVISGTTINSLWSDQSNEKNELDYVLEPNILERVSSLDPATLLKHEGVNGRSISLDWTQPEPPSNMPDHIKYARSVDWKRTPLGGMESWEPELRVAANMCMTDLHCAVLFWGSEGTLIYNEKYAGLIEDFHPCIGESVFTALKEYTDHVSQLFLCERTAKKTA